MGNLADTRTTVLCQDSKEGSKISLSMYHKLHLGWDGQKPVAENGFTTGPQDCTPRSQHQDNSALTHMAIIIVNNRNKKTECEKKARGEIRSRLVLKTNPGHHRTLFKKHITQ